MGIHLYDESPFRAFEHERLRPARVLKDAGIPFVIWGEDALSFAFFVPTCLFDFHILVPDECVDAAVKSLLDGLPCRRMDAPPEEWTEWERLDASRTPCFPNASWLVMTPGTFKNDPETIAVHPQSSFAFDVRDLSCSATLSPSSSQEDAEIRFPTLPALLDSLVATILDPPMGYRHTRLIRMLGVWFGYLFVYTPALRLPPGTKGFLFEPRHEAVVNAMKEENRSYVVNFLNGKRLSWTRDVQNRREVLQNMGRALGPAPTVDKPSPQAAPLSLSKAGADGDGAGHPHTIV